MRKLSFLLLFLCLNTFLGFAQDDASNSEFQNLLMDFLSTDETELDNETINEAIHELLSNPVHINDGSERENSRLFFLSDFQTKYLADFIRRNGIIANLAELDTISYFPANSLRKLAPFITFEKSNPNEKITFKSAFSNPKNKLLLGFQQVLEDQVGYLTNQNGYLGSPQRFYVKYRFTSRNLALGFTADKDAGEEFFKGSNPWGFDFYSAHLQFKTNKFLKTLNIGDFRADFGQGLVLSSKMFYTKSSQSFLGNSSSQGIRRSASLSESLYLRGVGTTFKLGDFELSLLYSNKKLDANPPTNNHLDSITEVTSIRKDGYHRTETEIKKKGILGEQLAAGNLTFRHNFLQLGLTACYQKYSLPIYPNPTLYNRSYFAGNEAFTAGFDFRLRFTDLVLYGEIAANKNLKNGMLFGGTFFLPSAVTLNLIYRKYAADFYTLHGYSFAENPSSRNEEGFLFNLTYNARTFKIYAYADLFRFPDPKTQANSSSFGYEAGATGEFYFRNSIFRLNLRYRNREQNTIKRRYFSLREQHNARLHCLFQYEFSRFFAKTQGLCRFQNFNDNNNFGAMFAQDLGYHLITNSQNCELDLRLNCGFFEADHYDTRLVLYEEDMIEAFSIPVLYGKGLRTSFVADLRLFNSFSFRIKYGITYYPNQHTVSTGLSQSFTNYRSEIKAQLAYQF